MSLLRSRQMHALAFLGLLASPLAGQTPGPIASGRMVTLTIHSRALADNLLGDAADRRLRVYLPAGYDDSPTRRYPVIYDLAGYGPPPPAPPAGGSISTRLDTVIARGVAAPVLYVLVGGFNKYYGSFWTNSQTTGNWDDYVAREIVAAIDSAYRTVAVRSSRGLTGSSMGGFGALMIGMRHLDVFGAILANSPCCLALEQDLGADNPAWRAMGGLDSYETLRTLWNQNQPDPMRAIALSAALAPNPQRSPFFADLPYRLEGAAVVPNEPAYSTWVAKLPFALLDRYAKDLKTLRGLRIEYGTEDILRHITTSVPRFSQELARRGIPHELEVFAGGHGHDDTGRRELETRVMPFFARTLEGAGAVSPYSREDVGATVR